MFRIAEPVVRLHQLITARYEPELVAGRADRVWERSATTAAAKIYGPHFEDLARQWCLRYADEETLGGVVEQLPKLLLFSRSGFTDGLAAEAATRPDIELVSLDRVYRGT
jgi:hypothetical protein